MHRRGRPGARTGQAKAWPHKLDFEASLALGRAAFFSNQPAVAFCGPGQVAFFGKQPAVAIAGPFADEFVTSAPCMHRRDRPGARTGAAKAAPHSLNVGVFASARPCRVSSINNLWLALVGLAKAAPHSLNVGVFASRALAKLKLGRISLTLWHLLAALWSS
jgi:hypothetical protein